MPDIEAWNKLIEDRRRRRLKSQEAQFATNRNPMEPSRFVGLGEEWAELEPGVYMNFNTGEMASPDAPNVLKVPPNADASIINTMAAVLKKGAYQPQVVDESAPNRVFLSDAEKRKAALKKF